MDTDRHLREIQAGDTGAFARWLALSEEPIRLSLRSFAAVVDTEAVLQEALLRVWQVAPRFVPDGRPDGLLRLGVRIARNLAVSERRRHHREVAQDDAPEPQILPALPDPHLRRAIEDCRRELPDKPAQALSARLESAGAEPDETLAARLGMRLNTFLQNFTRARRFLAECLERQGIRLEPHE
jgi:RNA polymerase sigma-70 factor (ECF subfamily)